MALNNVPLAGQTLTSSRSPINANFATISTAFAVDHVDYNTSGQGKHNKVTLPSQSSAPSFSNPEIGLYNKVPAAPFPLTTINELFIRRSAGGETPITATINDGGGAFATSGYYYLPSGLLVKWGSFTNASVAANTHVTVTKNFPVAANIPVFATIYTTQLTLGNNANPGKAWEAIVTLDQYNSSVTTLSIDINNVSGIFATDLIRIYYTAIGV